MAAIFIKGLLIGLSVAATIGPMAVLCIQRTVSRGFWYGLISGLGIATADASYGCIAAFGLTFISNILVNQSLWIRLIGGLFLIYLGIRTLLSKPAARGANVKANNWPGAYASTYLLTLTNPLTILSFAAIFAGLGVGSEGNAGSAGKSYLAAALVVLGVFLGSACWWVVLTSGISVLRGKFTARALQWINRISGLIILIFGIVALVSILL